MATITYLVLPSVVKERMSIHENVDDKLIYPEIKAAQDLYILPLLGSNLFNKIIADIAANTLSGNYKILMDNYLIDCICNYAMAEISSSINNQIWNKGVSQKTVDNATQPSMAELYDIRARYVNRAEHYSKVCRMYLLQNSPSKFPEYNTFVAGIDVIAPDRTSYSCPIYLGDESEMPKEDYSLNKKPINYNSNDPYYL